MKTISIFLALLNSLAACLVIAKSLSGGIFSNLDILWPMAKVVAGLVVICLSAFTWLTAIHQVNVHFVLLFGSTLAMIGMASIIWTLHISMVTGDLETAMLVYGGSIILQGISLPWNLQTKINHRITI